MDDEIEHLMHELILRRTQEKDFKSLEDQIRCLKMRFDALDRTHKEKESEESFKSQTREEEI